MIFITNSEKEFNQKIWRVIKPKLSPGFVVGLVGDLGTGKTTLVKYIAQKLGFKGQVSSPTFVVRQTYPIPNTQGIDSIEHIDLYRLGKLNDKGFAEVKEWLVNKKALVFVEWADFLPNKKNLDAIVSLKLMSGNTRKVEIVWN